MRITITGSLGHISKSLTQELLSKGHEVKVISHNPERQKDIEALGAVAAIGTMEDAHFLANAFQGSDAVYCMVSSERFYHRQFLTRKISNHKVLNQMEEILTTYFNGDDLIINGLPSVQKIADQLNVSPNYLSNVLKVLTGQSTQQHLHNKLIEKAKEKLSTTDLSVSEIAYKLGFEHSQSFSKLFKNKTSLSPLEFRQSFN